MRGRFTWMFYAHFSKGFDQIGVLVISIGNDVLLHGHGAPTVYTAHTHLLPVDVELCLGSFYEIGSMALVAFQPIVEVIVEVV
jgi:hypothetical protein